MKGSRKQAVRKGIVLSASLSMAAMTALTGCGNGEASKADTEASKDISSRYTVDASATAWKLDTKEMTELTWYVNADWWNTEWGNDIVTQKMEEDLHVKINFITGDDTKLNTYFAGEDMPDLITIFDSSSQAALKADSWAYPLYELADQYDPYFRQVASDETISWLQLDDGKGYGYADYSNTKEDYESGMLYAKTAFVIRKDVYEALGKPSMGTQEEFLNVLSQIKEQYPELYPLGFNAFTTDSTGSMGDSFQDFIGVPLKNEDNTFYNRNLDDDYLSWIRTFNQAYRNGCISDDSFADDGTAFEEKVKSGKYACIMMEGTPQCSGFLTTWMSENPDAMYIAIDGPQSTTGNAPALNQAGISGWMVSYITKSCSDPAKAIQIFTYLLSEEGQILTTYGIEGVTYTVNAEGKYELLPEIKEVQEKENDRFKKEYRLGEFIFFGHDKYKALSDDAYPDSIKQMQAWGQGKLVPHFILENTDPDAGTAEARSYSAIKTEWATSLVSMLRAGDDTSFEAALDEYKQFLADNDWDAIVAVKNEKMAKNVIKLGE